MSVMKEQDISIILADDHKLFRSGVKEIIKSSDKFNVIAEAENGEELIELFKKLNPDIMLVDISMPKISGIKASEKITKLNPTAKILFLSMYENEEYIYACYTAGGLGLINKNINSAELFNALDKVYNGQTAFSINDLEIVELLKKFQDKKRAGIEHNSELTKRERTILLMLSEGLTSYEMAERLCISKRTIDAHRTNLISKLKLKSLPELIRYAVEYSMIKADSE